MPGRVHDPEETKVLVAAHLPPSTFELLHHFRWQPMFTRVWYVPCNMQPMLIQWTVAQTHYPNHPRMTLVEYITKFP